MYRQARQRAEKAEHKLNAARDQVAVLTDALRSSMPVKGELIAVVEAWRASVQDEALEEAAELVADEGPCRHVDHVQNICACLAKAAMIRAMKGGTPS